MDLEGNVSLADSEARLYEGLTYDFEGMCNDADGHELFAIVSAVHHEGVGEALDDRALCFSEPFLGVAAGGMGDVDWGADLNVVPACVKISLKSMIPSLCAANQCQILLQSELLKYIAFLSLAILTT